LAAGRERETSNTADGQRSKSGTAFHRASFRWGRDRRDRARPIATHESANIIANPDGGVPPAVSQEQPPEISPGPDPPCPPAPAAPVITPMPAEPVVAPVPGVPLVPDPAVPVLTPAPALPVVTPTPAVPVVIPVPAVPVAPAPPPL